MVVVLPVFWSVMQLGVWWPVPVDAVVFATMLAVATPRALDRVSTGDLPLVAVLFVVGGAAAIGCGILVGGDDRWRVPGVVLFAAAVSLAVWVRRFGRTWRIGGTFASLPFLAVLVSPLPLEGRWSSFSWMLVAGAIALAWAVAVRFLALPSEGTARPAPAVAIVRPSRRFAPSTRMAIQLASAVLIAFVVAEWTDAAHLVWPVLTVLIVHSGNRGRGDVLWKGAQRVIGAFLGTLIATLLTGIFGEGDPRGIVTLFAIVAFGASVRRFGYVFWAAGITAALAFLYGYFGEAGTDLLAHRLLGILAGGVIGIASAWFVLPVRTVDVVRSRLSALLAAATDVAAATARGEAPSEPIARLGAADVELAHLDAVARTASRLGLGRARRCDGAVISAHALARELIAVPSVLPVDRRELAELATALGRTRRVLGQQMDGPAHVMTPTLTSTWSNHMHGIEAARLAPTSGWSRR